MSYKIFEYPISIHVSDIDENDHVNNISYLKWVQDVAIAHWNSVSDADMRSKYIWVVNRHEIDYLKEAHLNSKLIAKTWVVEPQGARSYRFVEIYDTERNTVIAKIKTTWILLDVPTKRPRRIESDIINAFL